MNRSKPHCQKLKLNDLPAEALIVVFHYLDEKSLGRIAQVCSYFNVLATYDEIWRKWTKNLIMVSSEHGLSGNNRPHLKEQYQLSRKWTLGRCKVRNVLKFEKNFLPWLAFDPGQIHFYLAVGDTIQKYNSDCWMKSHRRVFPSPKSSEIHELHASAVVHKGLDVCRFSVTEDYIVTGGWHGKLSWASPEILKFSTHEGAHASDISDVAILQDVIVSGSCDQTVKMWKMSGSGKEVKLMSTEVLHDTVFSTAVNKFKRIVAIGTGGVGGVHPLQIKDLQSGSHLYSLGESYKNGAGVLDCHFQTPDLLLSTGYDTYVRLWDTRASHSACVKSWEEPHDNTVYCVTSDNRYGFVSGSCRHGVTRLWDTRMKKCLQTFYLGGRVSSPVYSLRFTHTHLFAGLARGIFSLDFR